MLMFPPQRRYHHNLPFTDGLTMLANWLEIVAILVHYQSSYNTSLTIKPSDIASTRYQNISQRYIIRIRVNAFSFLNGLCILFQDYFIVMFLNAVITCAKTLGGKILTKFLALYLGYKALETTCGLLTKQTNGRSLPSHFFGCVLNVIEQDCSYAIEWKWL